MSAKYTASSQRSKPILFIVLGILVLAAWLTATLVQIQTSEAWILQEKVASYIPNLNILHQPVALFTDRISQDAAKAIIWGWILEFILLVCTICCEAVHVSIINMHSNLTKVFWTLAIGLIILDFWADFQYGMLPSGIFGQAAFAALCAFAVVFLGVIGSRLIEYGIYEWNR